MYASCAWHPATLMMELHFALIICGPLPISSLCARCCRNYGFANWPMCRLFHTVCMWCWPSLGLFVLRVHTDFDYHVIPSVRTLELFMESPGLQAGPRSDDGAGDMARANTFWGVPARVKHRDDAPPILQTTAMGRFGRPARNPRPAPPRTRPDWRGTRCVSGRFAAERDLRRHPCSTPARGGHSGRRGVADTVGCYARGYRCRQSEVVSGAAAPGVVRRTRHACLCSAYPKSKAGSCFDERPVVCWPLFFATPSGASGVTVGRGGLCSCRQVLNDTSLERGAFCLRGGACAHMLIHPLVM